MELVKLLKYVKEYVPFYQNIDCNSECDIEKIPIVNKNFIRSNLEAFLSNESENTKEEILSYLSTNTYKAKGWYNEKVLLGDIIIEETSGTSGTPFLCAKTSSERNELAMALWRMRKKIDKGVSPKNLFLFSHIPLNKENPNAYDYRPDHIYKLYSKIQDERVRWIHGTPVSFLNHIKIMKENEFDFDFSSLKYIECTGYYLREEVQKEIENHFGVKVINQYGCIETWPIALSSANNVLHVNEKAIFFEIIDDVGNVIRENNVVGRVVVTSLCMKLFPFIRYELGDYAMYVDEPDYDLPGRGIKLVEGRAVNIIKGIEGKKFGNILFLEIVKKARLVYKGLDVRYIQLVQTEENRIIIFINKIEQLADFVNEIRRLTKNELGKEFHYDVTILSEDEINRRNLEKPNIFLCQC